MDLLLFPADEIHVQSSAGSVEVLSWIWPNEFANNALVTASSNPNQMGSSFKPHHD